MKCWFLPVVLYGWFHSTVAELSAPFIGWEEGGLIPPFRPIPTSQRRMGWQDLSWWRSAVIETECQTGTTTVPCCGVGDTLSDWKPSSWGLFYCLFLLYSLDPTERSCCLADVACFCIIMHDMHSIQKSIIRELLEKNTLFLYKTPYFLA